MNSLKTLARTAISWGSGANEGYKWMRVSMVFKEDTAPSSAGSDSGATDTVSISDSGFGVEEILSHSSKVEATVLALRVPRDSHPYGEVRLVLDTTECQAGDYVAISPKNDPKEVDNIINLMKLDKSVLSRPFDLAAVHTDKSAASKDVFLTNRLELIRVPQPTTITQVLTDLIDLSGPPSYEFVLETQKRCGLKGKWLQAAKSHKKFLKFVHKEQPNLTSLLSSVEKQPTLEFLLLRAPLIQPRCYLVSTFSSHTVSIVYRPVQRNGKIGLASKYLQDLSEGHKVNAVLCKGSTLSLPNDPGNDVVMFAGYVGFAPFKAFMEARKNQQLTGRMYLFCEFGAGFLQVAQKFDKYRSVVSLVFAPTAGKMADSGEGEGLIRRCEQTEWKTQLPVILKKNAEVYTCGSPAFCLRIRQFVFTKADVCPNSPTPTWYHEEKICREVQIGSRKDKKPIRFDENLSFN